MTRTVLWFAGALAAALMIAACEGDPFTPPDDGRFVVQAYLYADEPVTDVRVTATLALGAADSVAPPINDAGVVLARGGERFVLVPTPGNNGYYHYPGEDIAVREGDVFDLEVTVGGVTATGRTTVPSPPAEVSLSPTELRVEGHGFWATEPVVVRWPNPDRAWYFITHRNVEPDPEPIFDGTVVIRPGLVVSEPTIADSAVVSIYTMRHYGTYDVRVHRVNEEYVQLYMSQKQDTRDLNEPATNIHNGLGIFTAFNRKAATFTLTR